MAVSVVALCVLGACDRSEPLVRAAPETRRAIGGGPRAGTVDDVALSAELRDRLLVALEDEGRIHDARVLAALRAVSRQSFVAVSPVDAWSDRALPIDGDRVALSPSSLAAIAQALDLHGDERVLVVGAGSGWEAAVLARLASHVEILESDPELAEDARRNLEADGVEATIRVGGLRSARPEAASVDRVVIFSREGEIPPCFFDALASGGTLVARLDTASGRERLVRIRRIGSVLLGDDLGPLGGR